MNVCHDGRLEIHQTNMSGIQKCHLISIIKARENLSNSTRWGTPTLPKLSGSKMSLRSSLNVSVWEGLLLSWPSRNKSDLDKSLRAKGSVTHPLDGHPSALSNAAVYFHHFPTLVSESPEKQHVTKSPFHDCNKTPERS